MSVNLNLFRGYGWHLWRRYSPVFHPLGYSAIVLVLCCIPTTATIFFDYLKLLAGPYDATPDDILKAYSDELANNLAWTHDLGALDDDLNISESGSLGEYGELDHSSSAHTFTFVKGGKYSHIYRFLSSFVDQHTDVISKKISAAATGFVQDPDSKRICGVVYEHQNKTCYAKANKGVIMCCGGFESNATMRQDYLSAPLAHPVAGTGNTGDGHFMCAKIGASFWHMHSAAGFWTNAVSLDGSEFARFRSMRKEAGITVGVNGRRFFMDWDMTTSGWPSSAVSGIEEPSQIVGSRHGHQQFGGEWELPPAPSTSWFIYDSNGAAKGAYGNGSGDPVADSFGYRASSIEELASSLKVPADELTRTVELWNSYCENGCDLSFFRPEKTLIPITTPPFYGVKLCCELLNTDGGPRRSAKGEILDLDGNPLAGLYSAGEFGSVWCNKYQGAG